MTRKCNDCGSTDIKEYIEADEYECDECGSSWAGYER